MANKKYHDIPDSDHVARRISNQKQALDENYNLIGIDPVVFQLRADYKDRKTKESRPEKSLSCSWLECFGKDREVSLPKIYETMSRKFPTKPGKPMNAKLAIMNVGKIKNCGTEHGMRLAVKNTPKSGDPSYSQISGLPLNNDNLELTQGLCCLALQEIIDFIPLDLELEQQT